jgi:hypothetical protein
MVVFFSGLAACSTLPRNPVPVDKLSLAQPVGMPDVRAWGGELSTLFQQDLIESIRQEPPGLFPVNADGVPRYDALALSGGGSVGAFGAGVLNGWTATGTRPTFKIVTGISTGALIAPFAFLGPAYDEQLKTIYTNIAIDNVLEVRDASSIPGSESIATTEPLTKLITDNIDETLLQAVAAAHQSGRRMYVGTTHLDAGRLVVWNMGLIAESGNPGALRLSASLPVAFPPVMIEVEVEGQRFDEMHVDGGTNTQVFFYGGTLDLRAAGRTAGIGSDSVHQANIYIIRNSQIQSSPKIVPRKILAIGGRAIDTMIKSSGVGDLYRIYAFAQREQVEFRYVDVPASFEFTAEQDFDTAEMNRLFDTGYRLATSGDPWRKLPPGY